VLTAIEDLSKPTGIDNEASRGFIILVDRGDCHFVQKVKYAQDKGAAGVIVADKRCSCTSVNDGSRDTSAAVCGASGTSKTCISIEPYMADDGTGAAVKIPSLLIDRYDAQVLRWCLNKDAAKCASATGVVTVALKWNVPTTDKDVEWELWTSADETTSFKHGFTPFAHKLKESTNFVPHYFIWDGEEWGCTTAGSCSTQCVAGGKYCSPDPDGATDVGVSGANIVLENLRQMCVWEQMDFKSDGAEKWWRYLDEMKDVFKRVMTSEKPATEVKDDFFESYSKEVHSKLGLDFAKTQKCMKMVNNDHDKLKNELAARKLGAGARGEILQLPSIVVNGRIIREGITTSAVLLTLCSATINPGPFCKCVKGTDGKNMELCQNNENELCPDGEFYCSDLDAADKCVSDVTKCPSASNSGLSGGASFALIVAIVAALGGGGFAYYTHSRKQMRAEMQNILAEYMPLEEMNNQAGGGAGGRSDTVGLI
jgi:hypothetical protein